VVNPRTGQPYTMHRLERMLERVGSGAEEALSTALPVAELAAPDALLAAATRRCTTRQQRRSCSGRGRTVSVLSILSILSILTGEEESC
jgi:hypothetical protein